MKALTVVLVTDHLVSSGGVTSMVIRDSIALAKLGIRVRVVGIVGPVDEEWKKNIGIEFRLMDESEFIDNPNLLVGALNYISSKKRAQWVSEQVSDLDPANTIIHFHGWVKTISADVFPMLKNLNYKIVVTTNEYFLACPNGSFTNYKEMATCKLAPLSTACLLSNCDSRNYAFKTLRFARTFYQNRILKIQNMIDVYFILTYPGVIEGHLGPQFNYVPLQQPISAQKLPRFEVEKNSSILFIGRLSPEKAPQLALEASKRLNKKITIVGDGRLRSLESEYPNAKFLGWIDKKQIDEEIRKSRYLVFSSIWYEGQPLVPLECALRGLPSLISDACSAKLYVNKEKPSGLIFNSNNLESLVAAMEKMEDSKLVENLSKNAYTEFWENYPSTEETLDIILRNYKQLLGDKSLPKAKTQ